MSLNGREFYTRNKDLQRYIDILTKEYYVEVPTRYAQEFSRNRAVQRYRDLSSRYITIAEDHKFKRSAIKIHKPLSIRKEGNKYIFELLL